MHTECICDEGVLNEPWNTWYVWASYLLLFEIHMDDEAIIKSINHLPLHSLFPIKILRECTFIKDSLNDIDNIFNLDSYILYIHNINIEYQSLVLITRVCDRKFFIKNLSCDLVSMQWPHHRNWALHDDWRSQLFFFDITNQSTKKHLKITQSHIPPTTSSSNFGMIWYGTQCICQIWIL